MGGRERSEYSGHYPGYSCLCFLLPKGEGPQTSPSPPIHQRRGVSEIFEGDKAHVERSRSPSHVPHPQVGTKEFALKGMDARDGLSTPLGLAALSHCLGGSRTCLGTGGKEPALGSLGPPSLVRRGGPPIAGGLSGRGILRFLRGDRNISHHFLQENGAAGLDSYRVSTG